MPSPIFLLPLFQALSSKAKGRQEVSSQRRDVDMNSEELGQPSWNVPERTESPEPINDSNGRGNSVLISRHRRSQEATNIDGEDEGEEASNHGGEISGHRPNIERHHSSNISSISHAPSRGSTADSGDQRSEQRPRHGFQWWRPFTKGQPSDHPGWLGRIRYFIWQRDPDSQQKDFVPNYRYLPILSGIISPFAILLEIPGLTEPWYVRTEGHQVAEYRSNPPILEAGMAVSMAFGVIANAALITRFLERRVKLMTIICMIFLVLHDIINIVTVIIFGVAHRFDDGFTYGKAYWMTVCSTVASLVVTITLGWDLWHTPDFARSGSGLTRKQRSLVILVMILIAYIGLGSLVFSIVMDLTFLDGLYFTVVSLETIGFGDIVPNNTGSRVFAIFYCTFGIINLGLVVTTTRGTIIESFENAYRKRRAEITRKRQEHKILKANKKARRIAIENALKEAGLPIYVKSEGPLVDHSARGGSAPSAMRLNEEALSKTQKETVQRELQKMNRNLDGNDCAQNQEVSVTDLGAAERKGRALELSKELQRELAISGIAGKDETHEESYQDFRRKIEDEERKESATKLLVAWTLFLTFWVVGAAIFMATESWSYGTALYFCWVSFVTIGYGDLTPKSPAGRAIFVVWALLGVAAMTILISVLSEAYSTRYNTALQNGSFDRAIKSFGRRNSAATNATSASTDNLPNDRAEMEAFSFKKLTEEPWPPGERTKKLLETARDQLDAVPLEVIKYAKAFNDHVRYFANHPQHPNEPPPPGLIQLLDELAEAEKMDKRMKNELLSDEEARKALFFMSYERAFKQLLETAERTVNLLAVKDAERDHLIAQLENVTGTRSRLTKVVNGNYPSESASRPPNPRSQSSGTNSVISDRSGTATPAIRFALESERSPSSSS